eukprot:IDg8576t1
MAAEFVSVGMMHYAAVRAMSVSNGILKCAPEVCAIVQ